MTRFLYWLIFATATFASLSAATILGFLQMLWEQDVTYLSLGIVVVYVGATALIGLRARSNQPNAQFHYVCEVLERVGILGTFIGLVLAFQALRDMDPNGEWRHHLLEGVSTKFLCSITGIVAAIFLRTQLRILGERDE